MLGKLKKLFTDNRLKDLWSGSLLLDEGIIKPDESALAILTGNLLKDPDATVRYHAGALDRIESAHGNKPIVMEPTLEGLEKCCGDK